MPQTSAGIGSGVAFWLLLLFVVAWVGALCRRFRLP
jgi:hypothetical protein